MHVRLTVHHTALHCRGRVLVNNHVTQCTNTAQSIQLSSITLIIKLTIIQFKGIISTLAHMHVCNMQCSDSIFDIFQYKKVTILNSIGQCQYIQLYKYLTVQIQQETVTVILYN